MRVLFFRHSLKTLFIVVLCLYFSFLASTGYFFSYRPEIKDVYAPIVEILGGENITIPINTTFSDPGVDAFDIGGELSLETVGQVDSSTVGDYEIKYIASDDSGNTTEALRKVRVIQPAGIVYLTFDDGPSEHTGRLLDVLKKYGVEATFFVTGRGDPALIKREYDEGHTVALHTNSHNYSYVYSSINNYFDDLNAISTLVKNTTGEESKLLRFPGGSSNLVSRRYDGRTRIMSKLVNEVTARGYTYFDWNVDSNDAGGAKTADEVFNNVTSRLVAGGESVVLQHDVKGFSVDAVERIIQYCNEHNFLLKKLNKDSFNAHHGVNN
jgi:peptidoglycan/xylan/chitin deacetylase (PgdA/CDA1 family)